MVIGRQFTIDKYADIYEGCCCSSSSASCRLAIVCFAMNAAKTKPTEDPLEGRFKFKCATLTLDCAVYIRGWGGQLANSV
jgi:hypothetical protein